LPFHLSQFLHNPAYLDRVSYRHAAALFKTLWSIGKIKNVHSLRKLYAAQRM